MDIDETDKKILNLLADNAKMPLRDLAKVLNVSFVTVMNRIKKLEKEKVITKYCTKINFEKLGYDTTVIIQVIISKGKLFELEKKIASSPEIYAVYDTTGSYDALVIGKFKSTRSMDNFIKKLQTFDFVERTNTMLVLNTIKDAQIGL
jgi:Lrp/AsnC family transcriptional regulator for asnA, asnC and gidA